MFRKKNNVIIGLACFNREMLKISIPAIARIKSRFILIIHNDNPATTIGPRDIRELGYGGPLHIINAAKNIGLRAARLRILDAATNSFPDTQWIIYVDEDDVLLSADMPVVAPNNFAVIQNRLDIKSRISDLMRAAAAPETLAPDGDGIVLIQPSLGIRGTAIRINIMRGVANLLHAADVRIREIDDSLEYRPPVDAMMWHALNIYANCTNPDATPIYMDCVNYISNGIDSGAIKYGRTGMPQNNAPAQLAHAMARYDAAIMNALGTDAAPQG